ncbi:MAG TPA: Hpt domain-containing protein, partial [Steroidobacteraceae bacterium]|nr:Hpt domain-containing protein [Steroidobacteraceae bacterium]
VELGDATAIGRAAHKLKGAAANLHVNTLATLSFELETRAKSGQQSDWRADLEKLAAEFARVCNGLRTEFGLEEPTRKTG